ncbi:MAG: hypothetical protein C4524_14835 [Candidatus Zixiibacteriota bacterium]|nr:MAG: hypothetical protein C4524_14835 [candidate division Zixibacteria bacterium]
MRRFSLHSWVLLCAGLTCLAGCGWLFPDRLPYTFHSTYTRPKTSSSEFSFFNLDGESQYEYLCRGNDLSSPFQSGTPNAANCWDGSFSGCLWQNNDSLRYMTLLPVPASSVGADPAGPCFLLAALKGQSRMDLALWDFERGGQLWRRTVYQGTDRNGDGAWDGSLAPVQRFDLDRDGREEILARATSGFDLQPRGIWAFRAATAETLWTYSCGAIPATEFACCDLDADGRLEIVSGTAAPGNGARTATTDDAHVYLVILEAATGKPLLEQEMGPTFSTCRTAILERGDRLPWLVTATSTGATAGMLGQVAFWQGMPPQLRGHHEVPEDFVGLAAYDVDGDGREEAVVTTASGMVLAFDPQARLPREYRGRRAFQHNSIGVIPPHSPFQTAILAAGVDDTTVIGLGRDLKPLFRLAQAEQLVPLEAPRFAAQGPLALAFGYFTPSPWPLPYREISFTLLGVLATLAVALTVSAFRVPLGWKVIEREFPWGVIWLSRAGRIRRINRAARRMLSGSETLPPEILKSARKLRRNGLTSTDLTFASEAEAGERQLSARLQMFPHGVLVLLDDITNDRRANFLRTWADGISRIVHFFKSPATTIQVSLQQWRQSGAQEEILARLEGQSDLLIRYAQRFKKLFSQLELKLEPHDLNQLIRRVLVPLIGAHGDRIQFDFTCEEERLFVMADRDQMEILLQCLLDNAVEALETRGQISVHTRRMESVKGRGEPWIMDMAEIEIRDNGPGMSLQALEQALRPGFSTKIHGMGLGLPQSRLITELHGGEMEIRSQPGVGTSVYISLPLVEVPDEE